jgi:hypothetical protein
MAIPTYGTGAYMPKEGWGVPTWPKREVGEPFGPLAIPYGGAGAYMAKGETPTWPKRGSTHKAK